MRRLQRRGGEQPRWPAVPGDLGRGLTLPSEDEADWARACYRGLGRGGGFGTPVVS